MPETHLVILGEKLVALRQRKGLTMKRFQKKSGLAQSTAYRVSSPGPHMILEEILLKIARAFEMKFDEIIEELKIDGGAKT